MFARLHLTLGSLIVLVFSATALAEDAPPSARLAQDGKAAMPVVISPDSSAQVRELAKTLADYLGRISGARFDVVEGDGRTGLALGKADAFPKLDLKPQFDVKDFGAGEQYLLRSHAQGLYAIGASDTAVQHAAWDLLYRLGYRQFFPGEVWEFVPKQADLQIAVDACEKPDYAARELFCAWGMWDSNVQPYEQWQVRNRIASSFKLECGHSYGYIVEHYPAEFKAHPEYMSLLGGKRASTTTGERQFCVSNPGLRKLVVRYAEDYLRENPQKQCVPIDPNDCGGSCECAGCRAIGSPSNQAVTLANDISDMLEKKYPGKYVGMYAYNWHAAPPTISVHPRVIICMCVGFVKGGWTVDQLIAGWRQQGVRQFGIREYYAINEWHRDLPGYQNGARLYYLAETLPTFHALGARFMCAESSDNWGPCGLGYYVASRLLWDVDEAKRVDTLVDDFLSKCFGSAKETMAQFYQVFNAQTKPFLSRDLIGRMYRWLDKARTESDDPAVWRRLDALALYVRYVELYRAYNIAGKDSRQAAFEQLIRHAYRIRQTEMVHSRALYQDLIERDSLVKIPAGATWDVPEGKNPWKSSKPWSRAELDAMLRRGIADNPVAGFERAKYSDNLVPARPLAPKQLPELQDSERGRLIQVYYTWFDAGQTALALKVTGGLIPQYRDRGNVRLDLFALQGKDAKLVDHSEAVPPDGRPREVTLHSDQKGLHKLVVDDGEDMTEVVFQNGLPRTTAMGEDLPGGPKGQRSGYFYVPPGTRVLGGSGSPDEAGEIRNADAQVVFRFSTLQSPDCFQVPVQPGQDGRFWSFHEAPDDFRLLTVPPYTAKHPAELLLPEEVVQKDAPAK